MKKKITIRYKNKKIDVVAEDCSLLKKFTGLMFSGKESSRALLFHFEARQKIRIHSLFVFYPFIAVWTDNHGSVADLKVVKPFSPRISPEKSTQNLIEIPINRHYKRIIKFLVGIRNI